MMHKTAIILALLTTSILLAQDPTTSSDSATDGLKAVVKLETTEGDIVLELDGDAAPLTVQNFLTYVDDGFYNGTIFHRVIKDFMIQGGGFTRDMSRKTDGLRDGICLEADNGLHNTPGTIAMARTADPHSATSQFFINVVDNTAKLDHPGYDGYGYTVFGKVIEGEDVVEKIRNAECVQHPKYRNGKVTPVVPIEITSTTIVKDVDRSQLKAKAAETIDKWENQLENFVKKVEAETGKKVHTTDSGLMYVILEEGTGDATPEPTDKVTVHYTGTLLNGTKFDSSVDRGTPATFGLNAVIKGWTEGVGMMKVGEKRKLIIPSELAYGKQGRPPQIPSDATLVFDIELIAINE